MKKTYVAPELFVEEFVADTMIASSGSGGNADTYCPTHGYQDCYAPGNQGFYTCTLGYKHFCTGSGANGTGDSCFQ